jgi:RNA polymerase sigma-70 factor (ECF subfamily)
MLASKRPQSVPAHSESDAALIEGIRRSDLAVFEQLFRANWDGLCRYAFCYLQSTDDAEEVVQSVFARIWESRFKWSVRGSVQDYLHLSTRNASFDCLRHDAVTRRWRERQIAELRASPADSLEPPAGLAQPGEFEAAVERALTALPAKRRRICELRFCARLSYAQIAELLQISPKTVETQVARGLKFLRSRLEYLRS